MERIAKADGIQRITIRAKPESYIVIHKTDLRGKWGTYPNRVRTRRFTTFYFLPMRYFYEPSEYRGPKHWRYYHCDHPMYNQCTLYFRDGRGLAVVQEHFVEGTKMRYWGIVDRQLANDIYISEGFDDYFEKFSGRENHGIFPTVQVRKLMWALRMKPLPREFWETTL